jgi:hypothetical protein
MTVGDDPADQREEHDRQLLQECIEPEKERRSRQGEHQPVFRQALHPCANARDAGAQPENAKVAMVQGRGEPVKTFGRNRAVDLDRGGGRVRLSQRIVPAVVS